MEILLIRHGQSTADLEDRHEGRADFELTALGRRQASALGKWLSESYLIDDILASPLKRAAATAEYISKSSGAAVTYHDELMEWDNGLLAGLYREEANLRFPLPPGGRKPHDTFAETESFIQFRARAETFWSKFLHRHDEGNDEKRVCIVSHGGMINMLFRCCLQLPNNSTMYFATGDTGVHLLRFNGRKRVILYMNCQEHLINL